MRFISTISTAFVAGLCAVGGLAAPLPIHTLKGNEVTPSPKFENKEYHSNVYRMLNDISCQTPPPTATKVIPTLFKFSMEAAVVQDKEHALEPYLNLKTDKDKRYEILYDMLESIKCNDLAKNSANTPANVNKTTFDNKEYEYHSNVYHIFKDISCQTLPPIVTKLVPTTFMALKKVEVAQNKENALTPYFSADKDEYKRYAALHDMLESIKCTDPANKPTTTPATTLERSPLVPEESIPTAPVFSHPIVLPVPPNSNTPWDPTTEPSAEETPSWKSKFNKFNPKKSDPSARMFPSMRGFSELGREKREEAATEEISVGWGPGRDILVMPPRRPRPPPRVGVTGPPRVGITGPPLDPLRGKGWTVG